MPGRERVAPEALRLVLPLARGLEELIGVDGRRGRADAAGAEDLDRLGNTGEAARSPVRASRGAQDRDRKAGVRLDRLGDLVDRGAGLRDEALDAAARLRERGQLFDGLEGVRQAVAAAALGLLRPARGRRGGCARGCGHSRDSSAAWPNVLARNAFGSPLYA